MKCFRTAVLAGLCVLVSCAYCQPVNSRGQYRVSFKIVDGKLAIDQDAFLIAPSLVKFEPAIRRMVQQAVAGIGALTPGLRASSAWPDFSNAYETWSAGDADRLDLGTLFSSDLLFSSLLTQTPDSGLILNEEEIDPVSGSVSFSILPPFDSTAVQIDLPGMLDRRQKTRTSQLRKRLARLNGALWSSANIRKAIAPLYANLGMTPQFLVLPRSQTIQIVEGPRIASIVLPPDQVPARDIDQLLRNLLDTAHFHTAMRAKANWLSQRVVDFQHDLGYALGDEPYAIPYQLQALQLLISPLGYTLTTQPSSRSGASQYVNLSVQKATKKPTRYLGAGFSYKPGQGLSLLGIGEITPLTLSAGGPSGTLGSASYSANFMDMSASATGGVSVQRNRVLDGVKLNEQSTGELASLEWNPWHGLDGNTVTLQLDPSHQVVLNQTLNTIEPGVQFLHNDLASEYPSRTLLDARVLIALRFADYVITAGTHRSFDHWEYDFSGRLENAVGDPPIFEEPSFGGADTVRGFRADDAIGRRLWSTQSELWHAVPHAAPRLRPLKIATFADVGGAYQTVGSSPGLREGLGAGLRLDLRVAVLKFDWAYGFGLAATGGSRGKLYFSVVLNAPH